MKNIDEHLVGLMKRGQVKLRYNKYHNRYYVDCRLSIHCEECPSEQTCSNFVHEQTQNPMVKAYIQLFPEEFV